QHLFRSLQIFAVLSMAIPIGPGHSPGFERVILHRFEALLLLLLGNVQEELQHHRAVFGEHAFELDDVAIGVTPHALRHDPLHALVEDAQVPTAVEDRHLALSWDLQPEAPEPGAELLEGARRTGRMQTESAWIKPLRQCRDRAALTGSIPSLEHDDRRDAALPTVDFEVVKPALQSSKCALVLFARELALQIQILQHCATDHSTHEKGATF